MSNLATFLNEIRAHPNDDEPRLVFADWLEEQGSGQGELIRVECELAEIERDRARRNTTHRDRRLELRSRRLQLIRQRSKGWAGKPLRRLARRWTFDRGVVTHVRMSADKFLQHAQDLLQNSAIASIDLVDANSFLKPLADCTSLYRIRHLGLPNSWIGRDGEDVRRAPHIYANMTAAEAATNQFGERQTLHTQRLEQCLRSPYLNAVESLNLADNDLGAELTQTFQRIPLAGRLMALDLSDNRIGTDLIETLNKVCPRLTKLKVTSVQNPRNQGGYYHNTRGGVSHLSQALEPLIARLETLEMPRSGNHLADLVYLGQFSSERLANLSIAGSMLWQYEDEEPTFCSAFRGKLFNGLSSLDLSSSYVDANILWQLHAEGRTRDLEYLGLNNSRFGPSEDAAIESKINFRNIVRLELDGSCSGLQHLDYRFGPASMRNLAHSNLRPGELSLRNQFLDGDFVRTLITVSSWIETLYDLDLRNNQIGSVGAERLLNHGPWNGLARLDLRYNRIEPAMREQLKARFGYRVVV